MIRVPYTIFTRICLLLGPDGKYYTSDMWEKDLSHHFTYIPDLHVCCPVKKVENLGGLDKPVENLSPDTVFPLREDRGWLSVARNFITNFLSVMRAVKASSVVHSGGAGWAFPLSYYILLARPFLEFKWVIIIESTFWMAPKSEKRRFRQHISEIFHRFMLRKCLRSSDARVFTQPWYRDVLLGSEERTLIAPATWIDEEIIISESELSQRHRGPLRLLYPSRMVSEKGIDTILSAIEIYEKMSEKPPIMIDMIGSGSQSEMVRSFAKNHAGSVNVQFLEPVPYGDPFFKLLRFYDGIIVTNKTEEQPRVILDAFSQGVPCLASATNGNLSLIEDGLNGFTFPVGSSNHLAHLLQRLADDPEDLSPLRIPALSTARKYTHANMHKVREMFLKKTLGI